MLASPSVCFPEAFRYSLVLIDNYLSHSPVEVNILFSKFIFSSFWESLHNKRRFRVFLQNLPHPRSGNRSPSIAVRSIRRISVDAFSNRHPDIPLRYSDSGSSCAPPPETGSLLLSRKAYPFSGVSFSKEKTPVLQPGLPDRRFHQPSIIIVFFSGTAFASFFGRHRLNTPCLKDAFTSSSVSSSPT